MKNNNIKYIAGCFWLVLALVSFLPGHAIGKQHQYDNYDAGTARTDSVPYMLLTDMNVQMDVTNAVNNMYNFKFRDAEREFHYFKYKYPTHPLPYFLLGLSQWWKMVPDVEHINYDNTFHAYMDSALYFAERRYEINEENVEAKFFLAAAYAFKGRLYSERKSWRKAASMSKKALDYLDIEDKTDNNFGPEFLFGDALYNYYVEWVPENYPLLRPLLAFFPDGDKDLGLDQLKEVAGNAFYTRTEAQYFLMRILLLDENDPRKALQISEYLHETFPDNPYFHRYYARLLYANGNMYDARVVSENLLTKLDSGMTGYEPISGRYAAFFLGQINERYKEYDKAKHYYERVLEFGKEIDATESGYYLYALLQLAKIYEDEGDTRMAKKYLRQVKKNGKRSHPAHEQAREYLKEW